MPPFKIRVGALLLAAASAAASGAEPPTNSPLDAQLFYQLLIGEIELRSGQAGNAYEVVLDAARRTKDEALFRRAIEVALSARAGDQALAAARAWRSAQPTSVAPLGYIVQLLIALNRPAELAEPLKVWLATMPAMERPGQIATLPRLFSRSSDRGQVVSILDAALQPYIDAPETRTAARVAIGRAAFAAGDTARALELAKRAHELEPTAEGPALLALEMLPGTPAAEARCPRPPRDAAAAAGDSHGVRTRAERRPALRRRAGAAADRHARIAGNGAGLAQPRRVAARAAATRRCRDHSAPLPRHSSHAAR